MPPKIEIKVSGHLEKDWQDWFRGMELSHEGDNTIISGQAKDQAFVHGLLILIRDLNLKLISVNPVEDKLTH